MNNRGFSLVEVLVAITLIAIALWSLVMIMGTGFTHIFTSSHKNQAIYKAQDAIEEKINQIEECFLQDEIPHFCNEFFPRGVGSFWVIAT